MKAADAFLVVTPGRRRARPCGKLGASHRRETGSASSLAGAAAPGHPALGRAGGNRARSGYLRPAGRSTSPPPVRAPSSAAPTPTGSPSVNSRARSAIASTRSRPGRSRASLPTRRRQKGSARSRCWNCDAWPELARASTDHRAAQRSSHPGPDADEVRPQVVSHRQAVSPPGRAPSCR
jgi:hypothetical protein